MKQMKSKRSAMLLAACAVSTPWVFAEEAPVNDGIYWGLSAGESKAHLDNSGISQRIHGAGFTNNSLAVDEKGTGYKAFVGFPISPYWAVETGYFDLGRFGFNATTTPAGTSSGSLRIKGLNLDMVGTLPISDKWSLLGRVGAAYAETNGTFNGTGAVAVTQPTTHKRETNYKYGIGTQYAFTPALTLRLEGERYRVNDSVGQRANVDLISLGLVYRFGGSKPAVKTAYKPYVAPAAEPMYKEPIVIVQAPVVVAIEPPAPAPKPWVKVKLEADSLFGFDQDTLQSDGKQTLDKLLVELKGMNVEAIQVTGHTDRLGPSAYNAKLSLRRAQAVQNYLVQVGGVPASKVSALGVGSSQPETAATDCKGSKATQALITCLRVDRHVDVEVTGQVQR